MSRFHWTKEKVAVAAKRYSTLSLFQHNAKGAYIAAIENDWLDDVTKHMKPNRQKWTKERIIELAKTFSTIADFRSNEPSAYQTAKANGWLKEASIHMTPLNIQWTDQMIIDEAKKYKTRREFEVKSASACTIARGRTLMDVACAHMERVEKYSKLLVYAYEFTDNSVYVGLTYNKSLWHIEHTSKHKSPVSIKIAELKIEPKMKMISDSYIDAEAASILEDETISLYKSKGWTILNSIKPFNIKWSDQMIIDEAKKYKTRREFEVKSKSACSIARGRKLMDLACAHMERVGNYTKRLVYVYEFPDNTAYIGLTYNKRVRHNDHTNKLKSPVYKKILELKFEPQMKIISDSYIDAEAARILEDETISLYKSKGWLVLNSIKAGGLGGTKTAGERLYQDKNACQLEALKYSTKKDFREGNAYAYRRAFDLQCLDEICSHMKSRSKSFEECSLEASKYKSISDFLKSSSNHYERAQRMGWIDAICLHMKRVTKWTPQLIAKEALKYTTRGDFSLYAHSAYEYARSHNLLEIVCKHMRPVLIKWTEKMVREDASKYLTHKDFRSFSPKAYEAAKNNGWFEKVTAHLKYQKK